VVPRHRGFAHLQVSRPPCRQPRLAVGQNPLPSTQLPYSSRLFHHYLLHRLVDWHRRDKPDPDRRCLSRFFGLGPLSRPFGVGLYFLVVATTGVIQNCATTLGEEIGWRGFLVPELAKRFSFTATAILSGVIWALWHVPIIVFAGYNVGTGWYGLAVVSANMISLCFVLTWLRLKSGSLWTGVILHASNNHFIQQFFDPMTAYTGRAKYILGEFGIGFTLVVAVRRWPNLSWTPTNRPTQLVTRRSPRNHDPPFRAIT